MEIPVTGKELKHRLRQPGWLLSHTARIVREAWDGVSPSRYGQLYRRIRPFTMCSSARLRGLHLGVQRVVLTGVPGDIVECGVARGGSAALMALTLQQLRAERKLWLFDTFEGLPSPTRDDPDFEIADLYTGTCAASVEQVSAAFASLGIRIPTEFVPGLFQETLPRTPIQQIALLHVDGDWYDSVKVCFAALYDKVVPGGVIQIDDYGHWQGARRAIDEFFSERGSRPILEKLDFAGRYFIKA